MLLRKSRKKLRGCGSTMCSSLRTARIAISNRLKGFRQRISAPPFFYRTEKTSEKRKGHRRLASAPKAPDVRAPAPGHGVAEPDPGSIDHGPLKTATSPCHGPLLV